jgi:hypothetical protein
VNPWLGSAGDRELRALVHMAAPRTV